MTHSNINELAVLAQIGLKNGDQTYFNELYKHPEIVQLRKSRTATQLRKNATRRIINEHDIDEIIDMALYETVLAFDDPRKNFMAHLNQAINFKLGDKLREESRLKRRANHYTTSLVDDITRDDSDDINEFKHTDVLISDDDPEFIAVINALKGQLDEPMFRLIDAIITHQNSLSLSELAEYCGFKNKQAADRALKKLRKILSA